jgi:hypothetical protein
MTTPDPALVERARQLVRSWATVDISPDFADRIAAFAAEVAAAERTRYVMADAGWKEMNRQNEVLRVRKARLREALKQCADAFALALSESGQHDEHDQQTDPDTMCLDCWAVRQARAALAELG